MLTERVDAKEQSLHSQVAGAISALNPSTMMHQHHRHLPCLTFSQPYPLHRMSRIQRYVRRMYPFDRLGGLLVSPAPD